MGQSATLSCSSPDATGSLVRWLDDGGDPTSTRRKNCWKPSVRRSSRVRCFENFRSPHGTLRRGATSWRRGNGTNARQLEARPGRRAEDHVSDALASCEHDEAIGRPIGLDAHHGPGVPQGDVSCSRFPVPAFDPAGPSLDVSTYTAYQRARRRLAIRAPVRRARRAFGAHADHHRSGIRAGRDDDPGWSAITALIRTESDSIPYIEGH
jgi:hypothetical protein